jgi:hypothetical protein
VGPDAADDLAGEVFRVAFERRATYATDRPDCLPWLYGIAARAARAGTTARTCTRPTTWVGGEVHVTLRESSETS